MRQRILAGIILSLTAAISVAAPISGQGTWETTLQGRAPLTPNGTDYQAYYDTALNVTWLADANLAASNTFGVSGIGPGGSGNVPLGRMPWVTAQAWIAAMNSADYLGVSDWRLPTVTDTGTPGCNFAYTGTDCGFNVDLSTGEMAHMFYSTLGNPRSADTSGNSTGCADSPPYCLTNDGPFSNLLPFYYWSGTTYAPSTSQAWLFYFLSGFQLRNSKDIAMYGWAVRPGDIGIVPIPAAVWLLGSALGVLCVIRRTGRR